MADSGRGKTMQDTMRLRTETWASPNSHVKSLNLCGMVFEAGAWGADGVSELTPGLEQCLYQKSKTLPVGRGKTR